MHRPIFGHSFAVLVAPILLAVLAFNFLNKKKTSARRNAEDVDTGASGSMAAPTETNSDGSSPSPTKANNGASSSLTGNCYEVFLSFRGLDTRHGFTDHLYKGLVDAGIDAFRDDDELCYGEDIKPVLIEAITSSKILIPIFSENYGTSSWCLDELVQMMERKKNNGQIVLPIFYKVKPAEVRYQTGRFGEKFHQRKNRLCKRSSFDPATLEKWKKALDEVSTLKGYEAQGSEADLVKSVVQKALNELKKKFELVITENLVGIDSHVNEVMDLVDNKSNATLFVGIYGMGGIGKTTLAKIIYNKLSNQFELRSFIADIRESCKHNGVHYLQNQLINDILKQNDGVHNKDEGIKIISSKFKGKKVLVLLDDVDEVVQLKCLAGDHDWFSSGSKIIITTRNKRILEEAGVDYNYEHKEMDKNPSLILFSKHAFRRDSPPREFKGLTNEVVSITGGLPLSLEVFGSLLCGKESTQWINIIKKLKRVPHIEVQKKLRISYESLDYGQKQIFLDIACFFIGTNKIIASYMWDACGFFPGEGIEALIFLSLIKVGNNHELRMHDQLRDLGREIVRKENQREFWCRSRLWDHEEVRKVLKDNKGTDKIEGINLSKGNPVGHYFGKLAKQDCHIYTANQLKNLTSLRFLLLDGAHLSGDFEDSMKELKWLQWPNCPMNFEVKNFRVEELAVFESRKSEINEKWEGWSFFMMAEKLKYLDLSFCDSLEDTDFLLAFKKLEVLILNYCTSLKRIDSSIGDMEALIRLELCQCKSLTKLPVEIGKLKALQQLLLKDTKSLSTLPDSIESFENLEILEISSSGIEELPNGIGRLRKLQELRASFCSNMEGIMAESMCNLSSLRHLNFGYCRKLQSLPNLPASLTYLHVTCRSRKLPSLSHLTHLKKLEVNNCEFLECIEVLPSMQLKSSECSQPTDVEESESPQSLDTPLKLEILYVNACGSIKTMDVSQFIHLRRLQTYSCKNLLEVRGLDKLIYLESLAVLSCDSIQRLDLPKFEASKELDARVCKKLAKIQGLDRLEYLDRIDIERCTLMERQDLPKFGRLKELIANGCKNLAEIQGLDGLEYLERLDIEWCTLMERLDLPKSGRLKELQANGCENLVEIQGLDRLEYLEILGISRCTSIGRLLLPKSGRLKKLDAGKCENLAEIQGLDGLEYLERLDIGWCTLMERLDLPKSGRLKELKANNCENLAEIQGLDRLEYLERLGISRCTSIGRLLLPKSERLKELDAEECENLVEIQGLDGLEYLERLDIGWCTLMERLDLPKSGRLKELKANSCENLVEIQGLDRSEYLERLGISRCTSIRRLLLPKFGRLKELDVGECENLVEIQDLDGSEYLERLDIEGCTSMERLYLPKVGRLKELQASGCKILVEIQGLNGSEYLVRLDIKGCTLMERLDFPKSKRLWKLNAEGCKNLAEIQGLDSLECLKSLDIKGCTSMERLYLPKSGKLKELQASRCKNLIEIQGLDRLEYLERLDIGRCTLMKRLYLPKFGRLKELDVSCCKNLAEIQDLDSLEYLESLYVSQCTSIGRLDLPKSGSMKILYAYLCKKLVEIQGLDRLESLEELDISSCTSIERLLLPKSKSLKILEARDCENLVEIMGLNRLESLKELNIIGCKLLKTIPELSRTWIYRYDETTDGETMAFNIDYLYESNE